MTTTTSKLAGEQMEQLIDELSRSHEPVQIVGMGNSAMLVSEADWRAIQETCHLLSIPRMCASIPKASICRSPIAHGNRGSLIAEYGNNRVGVQAMAEFVVV